MQIPAQAKPSSSRCSCSFEGLDAAPARRGGAGTGIWTKREDQPASLRGQVCDTGRREMVFVVEVGVGGWSPPPSFRVRGASEGRGGSHGHRQRRLHARDMFCVLPSSRRPQFGCVWRLNRRRLKTNSSNLRCTEHRSLKEGRSQPDGRSAPVA